MHGSNYNNIRAQTKAVSFEHMWFPTVHVLSTNNMLLVVRSNTRTCGLHGQNKAHNLFYIIAVAHLSSAVGRPHYCNTPTIDASTHSHVLVRSDKQKKAPLCTIIIISII